MALLDELNPPQREAAETVHGPVLVLAGAGSGKTRAIRYRIAHLVENGGASPDSILACTFTNQASQWMALRGQELLKANALDFDDLLLEAARVLKASGEVRQRYNRRFQYLLIDEYQDTNRPQYELMRLLAGSEQNVCVVGDEDQSIYSWRGADI